MNGETTPIPAGGDRTPAEAALRASEARRRALATASADVTYRMSPDWGAMCELDGRDFLADTPAPSGGWLAKYIPPTTRRG